MERGSSVAKKLKVNDGNDQIFESFLIQNWQEVLEIRRVVKALKYGFNSCVVRSLKVDKANACCSVPFAKASIDFSQNNANLGFPLGLIFRKAGILVDYIHSDPEKGDPKLPDNPEERSALRLLLEYVQTLEKESKLLSQESLCDLNEWCWTLKFAQHVFSKLSLNPCYICDVQKCSTSIGCPCPEQDEPRGRKGDTSFGLEDGWHGMIDILIGGDVPIVADFGKEEDLSSPSLLSVESDSSFDDEVKQNEAFSANNYRQIFSKTITFSFLKNKEKPNITLIPTIAVNKGYLQVHFYDSEKDILLQSGCFQLFSKNSEGGNILNIIAVTVIWLTLNYKIFCTGTVEGMPCSSFHNLIRVQEFKDSVKSPCNVKNKNDQSWVCDTLWANGVKLSLDQSFDLWGDI